MMEKLRIPGEFACITRDLPAKPGKDVTAMKTITAFMRPGRAFRFFLVAILLSGSVALFVFSTMAQTTNDTNICIVCHKNTTTLTLTCNSLDYRRHKDHGDPDGACSASQ
jgi:hypothetical protein